jgi:hypothetical protein
VVSGRVVDSAGLGPHAGVGMKRATPDENPVELHDGGGGIVAKGFRFGAVVAPSPADVGPWRDQTRRVSELGYSTLLMPDGMRLLSPFSTLAVAAEASARADLHAGRVDLVVVDAGSILLDHTSAATDTATTVHLARAVARTPGVQQAFRAAGLTASVWSPRPGA